MAADAPLTAPKRRARRKTSTTRGPQGLPTASAAPSKANVRAAGRQAQKPLSVPVVKQDQRTEGASDAKRRVRVAKRRQAAVEADLRVSGDRPGPDRDRGRKQSDAAIKAARIAYVRANRKPWVDPKAELEGHGELAKLSDKLGKAVTGSKVGSFGAKLASAKLQTQGVNVSPDTVGKVVKDAVNLPAQAVPSVYVPARAAVKAATGDTKPAKAFLKDLDEHDPVVNAVAAGVDALKGDKDAARRRVKRVKESVDEHPGFALAEVASLGHGVTRGAARAERVVRPSAREARVTGRVAGTALEEPRPAGSSVVTRRMLRRRDKKRFGKELEQRRVVEETTDPDVQETARRKVQKVSPATMRPKQIHRRVDERVQLNEDVRRHNRDETVRQVRKAVKKVDTRRARARGKTDAGDLVSLVAQRIVKPTREDLGRYRDELAVEHPNLDRRGQHDNARLRHQIDRALKSNADLGKVAQAADEYKRVTDPLQDKLVDRGFLDKDQADRAKVIPYAVRNMGARHNVEAGRLELGGEELSTGAVKEHMAANGVAEPAFVTQAPGRRGGGNFNVRSERPQALRMGRRTGEATRQGTFDSSRETLPENAARMQGLVDAADGFHGFVKEFGVRGKSGKPKTFGTFKQAKRAADNSGLPGEQQYVPVRVHAFGARREQLEHLLETGDTKEILEARGRNGSPVVDAMLDAIDPADGGNGPWALVPKEAADQLRDHLSGMGVSPGGKGFQAYNQLFRQSVLSTSPSWMAGNVIEASLRAALDHAGPRSYLTGRRTLKRLQDMDPEAALEAQMRTTGGGHFAFADRTVHRSADQFAGTRLEPLANALATVRRTPGPKQVADAWGAYTDVVFGVNKLFETQVQTAMLGRKIRSELLTDRMNKLSNDAIDEAARGLRNTTTQVRLGREIDRAYGKYNKWSPGQRKFISYYTPFIAWSLNAARFVADVLPRDHPVVTALIASTENATDEWRKDHGLDLFIKDRLPGFLQGSIPLKGGAHQRAPFRYTPFGAFGSPTDTVGSLVLPQVSGALDALQGREWTGKELRSADGGSATEADRALHAAGSLFEGSMPFLAVGLRVMDQGPGALNPFRATRPAKRKGSGGVSAVSSKSGLDLGTDVSSGPDLGAGLSLGIGG